jgi:MoaA/NifB/PqqE/SkfB family radical SAM enzyme
MKSLNVNLFFKCNARCIFCVVGVSAGQTSNRNEMTLEDVLQALRRGYGQGCRTVTFSGGEPTIYPGLAEAARYARDLGYRRVEIKTNGLKLSSPTFVRELIDAGVGLFSISIHGPDAETHNWLVNIPRAFERAVRGAHLVREMGGELSLPTCIQQGNYRRLPETVSLLVSLDPTFVLPTFIEPSGSAAVRFDEVVPRYRDVEGPVREAAELLQREPDIIWAFHGFPMCRLPALEQCSYDLVRNEQQVSGGDESDYFEYERHALRAHGEPCWTCRFKALCGGPWREYVDHHGWDEFHPIESIRPVDVIPLPQLAQALFRGHTAT